MSVQTTYAAAAVALEGQLFGDGPHDVRTMINQEASAEVPFGHGVKFEGSTEDLGALLPTAETSVIAGIVAHSHAYADDELGTTGVLPGATLNVLRKGKIWVAVEDGCAPGDRLWIRAVGAVAPEAIGQCNNADDSTDMVDCTNAGVFLTTAAAGGLAVLDVDFTNRPT